MKNKIFFRNKIKTIFERLIKLNSKDDKMDLLDVMLKRRSVRKYTEDEIPNEKMNRILQAGLLAPTSRNLKPCNFLIIENKEVLKKISESKAHGAAFLKDANKAIAVIGNSMVADTWIEDSSIALAFMHLMATEQDVGSCWIQIRLRESKDGESTEELVRDLLGLDDYFGIVGILALGIEDGHMPAYSLDDIDKEKIHYLR